MTEQPSGAVGIEFGSAAPMYSAPYLREPVLRLAGRLRPSLRVLDAGCGNGDWAGLFARRGCTVVGVDPSPSGIEIARATYPGVRFERTEVTEDILDRLGEAPFDLVVSTEVVEHLYDPASFVRSCYGALVPGGRLIVSTPFHGRLKDIALAVSGALIGTTTRYTSEVTSSSFHGRHSKFCCSTQVSLISSSLELGGSHICGSPWSCLLIVRDSL